MKFTILIIIISATILFSCYDNNSDDDHYKSNGKLTGYDMRECACCGGWFIEIGDSTYRFWEFPKESDINQINMTFPINVKLDWNKKDSACMDDLIDVIRIKKR